MEPVFLWAGRLSTRHSTASRDDLSRAGRAKSKRLALRYHFTREFRPTHHVCKRAGGDYVPDFNDYVFTTARDAACSIFAA